MPSVQKVSTSANAKAHQIVAGQGQLVSFKLDAGAGPLRDDILIFDGFAEGGGGPLIAQVGDVAAGATRNFGETVFRGNGEQYNFPQRFTAGLTVRTTRACTFTITWA